MVRKRKKKARRGEGRVGRSRCCSKKVVAREGRVELPIDGGCLSCWSIWPLESLTGARLSLSDHFEMGPGEGEGEGEAMAPTSSPVQSSVEGGIRAVEAKLIVIHLSDDVDEELSE